MLRCLCGLYIPVAGLRQLLFVLAREQRDSAMSQATAANRKFTKVSDH
jgi:hypothetical protein